MVIVGDVIFARVLRERAPNAYAAAGFPAPSHLAIYSPLLTGQYFSFILRREFRQFLPPQSSLRALANVLYVLHVLLIGTAVLGVALQLVSSLLFRGRTLS
jgi:hypothetical protein